MGSVCSAKKEKEENDEIEKSDLRKFLIKSFNLMDAIGVYSMLPDSS
jgi:hypothetical protein